MFNYLRCNVIVRLVDIGGIVDHLFYPLTKEVAMGYSNATVCPSFLPSFRPSVLP
jgi:hypothetical protein